MEGPDADVRTPQRGGRGAARAPSARGAALRGFHALARGTADSEGAEPRPGEPRRQLAPQRVSVRDDRSGDHAGRGREMVEAVVGNLPARATRPARRRLTLGFGIWDLIWDLI